MRYPLHPAEIATVFLLDRDRRSFFAAAQRAQEAGEDGDDE